MRSLLALAAFVLAAPAQADVLNVPGDYPTMQAALDVAQDGDEIMLAEGTYTITQSLDTFGPLSGITLRSADPEDPAVVASTRIVVDASSLYSTPDDLEIAGLTVAGSTWDDVVYQATGTLVIRDSVIEAAADGDGPGLFHLGEDDDRLELRNVHFVGDTGRIGGSPGTVVIDNCTAEGGTTTNIIDARGNTLYISNMTFDGASGQRWSITDPIDRLVLTNVDMIDVLSPINILALNATEIELVDCRFENVTSSHPGLYNFMPIGSLLATVTARGCTFIDNNAVSTGPLAGACINAANVDLQDCVFIGNHTASGAVFATESFVIDNCRFEGNTGGVATCGRLGNDLAGPARITDSEFINNGDRRPDGTVANVTTVRLERPQGNAVPVLIEGCTFVGNSAREGGAITSSLGTSAVGVTVRRSRFHANYAEAGGAYANARVDDPTDQSHLPGNSPVFDSCAFVGNTALNSAVAVGSFESVNSTFVSNTAAQQGHLGHGTFILTNTVYAEPTGPQGTFGPAASQYAAQLIAENSAVPARFAGATSTALDPLFVRNPSDGGDGWGDDPSTPGIDESLNDDFGDLRVRPGSPAIDAGTNAFFTPGDTDLDGNPRLADDPGVPGNNVDIGAYEFQGTTCLADVNQDGQLSPNDFNAWILAFNENSPLADQNRDGEVRQNDFNAWILNFNAGC